MPSAELEQLDPTSQRQAYAVLWDPDMDFRKLASEAAFFTRGFRLVEKDALLGVPHVITGITYRKGYPQAGVDGDYVSVEAIVADEEFLTSPVVEYQRKQAHHGTVMPLTVFPNEPVIYNDGGTGIRRAMTELFTELEIIDPGQPKDGENRFDRPYSLWKKGANIMTAGINGVLPTGEKFRFLASRGLRASEYENEYGSAVTYYLG